MGKGEKGRQTELAQWKRPADITQGLIRSCQVNKRNVGLEINQPKLALEIKPNWLRK